MRSLASFFLETYTVTFCRINLKLHLFHLKNLFLQQVVDVDLESPDMNNPNFHILCKDSSEDIWLLQWVGEVYICWSWPNFSLVEYSVWLHLPDIKKSKKKQQKLSKWKSKQNIFLFMLTPWRGGGA